MKDNFSKMARELCDLLGIDYDLGAGRATLDGVIISKLDMDNLFPMNINVTFNLEDCRDKTTSFGNNKFLYVAA